MTASTDDRLVAIRRQLSESPESVSASELVETLLETNPADRNEAIDALRSHIRADATSASEVATELSTHIAEGSGNWNVASYSLAVLAIERPGAVAAVVPTVVSRLGDENALINRDLLCALVAVAREQPDVLVKHAPAIAEQIRSAPPSQATIALDMVEPIVDADPTTVPDFLSALIHLVRAREGNGDFTLANADADRPRPELEPVLAERKEATVTGRRCRRKAGGVIGALAVEHTSVDEQAQRIVEALEDTSDGVVASSLLDAIGAIAERRPERATDAIQPAGTRLSASESTVEQARSAWVLGLLAETDPDRVIEAASPGLSSLLSLLEEDDVRARRSAAGLLSYIAEDSPEDIEPFRSRFHDRLEDEDASVRASTAWILAFVGTELSRERLEELAERDPIPEVRSAATAAIETFDDRR